MIALAHRYREWNIIERSFRQANISAETRMREQAITSENVVTIEQMLSALLYPYKQVRASQEIITQNTLGQSGLWPYGISGDYPIVVVTINHPQKLELIREVLQAHRYWRERRMMVDLVILNEQQVNYGAELNDLLYRLITHTNSDNWLNQRGGVYILHGSQIKAEEQILLQTAARVVLDGDRGSLKEQLADYFIQVPHLPAFNPSRLLSDVVDELHLCRIQVGCCSRMDTAVFQRMGKNM